VVAPVFCFTQPDVSHDLALQCRLSGMDPSTYGNRQKDADAQELDIGKMHLDAIRKLGSG